MDMMAELDKVFEDPQKGLFASAAKLRSKLGEDSELKPSKIREFLKNQELNQLFHRPQNKHFMKINAHPKSFQIDVMMMPQYKASNRGVDRLLLLIDILTRKMFAYPLKGNTVDDILDAYEQFMEDARSVHSVTGDYQFHAKAFREFNENHDIKVFSDVARDDHVSRGDKLGLIDRAVRTLRSLLLKAMLLKGNTKWVGFLGEVVKNYNTTPHAALNGDTPDVMWKDEIGQDALFVDGILKNNKAWWDIDTGDYVRILQPKGAFDKEGQTYSSEVYKVVGYKGYKYKLKDEDGNVMDRLYKYNELLRIDPEKLRKIGDGARVERRERNRNRTLNRVRQEGLDAEKADEILANPDGGREKRNRKSKKPVDYEDL